VKIGENWRKLAKIGENWRKLLLIFFNECLKASNGKQSPRTEKEVLT
jgi:hypothetical protein